MASCLQKIPSGSASRARKEKMMKWVFQTIAKDRDWIINFQSFLIVPRDLTAISVFWFHELQVSIFQFQNEICPESRQLISIKIFYLSLVPNFIKLLSTSIVGPNLGTRSSIPNSIFKFNVFSLLWIPNFVKITLYLKRRTKYAQIWNFMSSFKL